MEKIMRKYKKRGRKLKKPSKQEFEMLYYEWNISRKEMAEKYGVKKQTISNWATEFRKE